MSESLCLATGSALSHSVQIIIDIYFLERIEDSALSHCVQLRFLDLSFNKLKVLGNNAYLINYIIDYWRFEF